MIDALRVTSTLVLALWTASSPAMPPGDTVSRLVRESDTIYGQGERVLVSASRSCVRHGSAASSRYGAFRAQEARLQHEIIEFNNRNDADRIPDNSRERQAVKRLVLFGTYTYNGTVTAVEYCWARKARNYYVIARELLAELHRIDAGAGDPSWKAPSRGLVPQDAKLFDL
ncbi:MAG: hypothetical protein QOF71_93 [Candidatus Eremiobacteraeota bacterium]|jgi:hypothetical protein|nr:hypothetical protein [Candidatus Eremiobacteraeota bacterium]